MDKKYIALTFDDGPSIDATPALLELAEKYGVPLTFFVCGQSITVETVPILRRAFDMGCEICNHSTTHPAFTGLTHEQMVQEVEQTSALIEQHTGRRPQFFRPPFISVSEQVMQTVDMNFICGVGTEDWEPTCTAQRRFDDIMAQVRDGIIILMHDSADNTQTVEAVGRIIPALIADGYTLVTVSQLFAAKGVIPQRGVIYSIVPQEGAVYKEKWFVSEDKA